MAPILDIAAFIFAKAPENVSLPFLACSPKALSIASANCWNEILPSDTISRTSDSVLPIDFPNIAAAFKPLDAKEFKSIAITRPWPAILVNIFEISSYVLLVIAATPEIALKDLSISSPTLTLEAKNCDAALAAES